MPSVTRASYPSALDVEQAAANHSYIRVTGKRNKNMSIAGIFKTFNNPDTHDWIYVPALHLMGDPHDVYNAILNLNFKGPNGGIMKYTPEQAAEFTDPGLNQNNYNIDNIDVPDAEGGMKDTLDRELAETEATRREIRAQGIIKVYSQLGSPIKIVTRIGHGGALKIYLLPPNDD